MITQMDYLKRSSYLLDRLEDAVYLRKQLVRDDAEYPLWLCECQITKINQQLIELDAAYRHGYGGHLACAKEEQ